MQRLTHSVLGSPGNLAGETNAVADSDVPVPLYQVRTSQMGQAPIAPAVSLFEDWTLIGASPICSSCRAQCGLELKVLGVIGIFDCVIGMFLRDHSRFSCLDLQLILRRIE